MKSRIVLIAWMLSITSVLFADPTVTISRAAQRYPWNGLVDLDYTVAGVGDADFHTLGLSFIVGSVTNKMSTFVGAAPTSSNGTHHVVWNAAADGVTTAAKNAAFAVDLTYHPIASDGDYMIVDISGGTNAAIWQVTYMSGVTDPAATFNNDEYKTTKLVFKKLPAGSFWMGSTTDTSSPYYDDMAVSSGENNELPRHYVKLTKDFYLMLFQLTARQYELMTGALTAYNAQYYKNKPMLPIGGVTKNDTLAETFPTAALNLRAKCAGLARTCFDLPTEAQWEYACRAGTTTRFYFGDDASQLADHAWYTDKVTKPDWGHDYQNVGLLLPNPWGFYDMYGNAPQLMKDDQKAYESGDETNPVIDPCYIDPWRNASGIARGGVGTWSGAASCRSAARKGLTRSSTLSGLRLAFVCEADVPVSSADVHAESSAAVDLSADAVRAPASVNDILPFAYNNTTDWTVGGDVTAAAAAIEVAQMTGDAADPSSWLPVEGKTKTLTTFPGEATAVWLPSGQFLYRAKMTVGETVSYAHFNLSATTDIKPPMTDMAINLSSEEVNYTTDPVHPTITVKTEGGATLAEGTDYTLTYSDDVNVGTCLVKVTGIGNYCGEAYVSYAIVYPLVATSDPLAARFDLRTDQPLVVQLPQERVPWAWNSTADWTWGGDAMTIREPDGWCLVEMGGYSRRMRFNYQGFVIEMK